ncbi:MAG: hypothetical protein WCP91_03870 [Candidatus Berkelbacteria bacterium]
MKKLRWVTVVAVILGIIAGQLSFNLFLNGNGNSDVIYGIGIIALTFIVVYILDKSTKK